MAGNKVVHIEALLALNPEYAEALARGEGWALSHMSLCESLNRGEHEGFRRPFDGKPRKWCGAACTSPEGCVTCTLPENPEMARSNREERKQVECMTAGAVLITGEVNEQMVGRVKGMIDAAVALGVPTLDVIIESHGGHVRAGMKVYDLIRAAPVTKRIGSVPNYAYSMAAIILQACDERIAAPNAFILMHHTRLNDVTIETLRNKMLVDGIVALAEPHEQRMEQILIERTGRTAQEIKKLHDKDKRMTSKEALAFGIIDAIRK